MGEWWTKTPLWWRCPYCDAPRGQWCRTPSGYTYKYHHTARWRRMTLAPGIRGVGQR